MLNHKAILISLDATISLPIALASFLLLFWSYHANLAQLSSLGQAQLLDLKLYSKSQILVQALETLNPNYAQAVSFSSNFSAYNNMTLTIYPITNATFGLCSGVHACRIVKVQNNSYLLVLKNENPS